MDGALAGAFPYLRASAGRQVVDATHVNDQARRNNRRTALVLASIVFAFFVGVIVRRWLLGH